jgi:hypothetical protein
MRESLQSPPLRVFFTNFSNIGDFPRSEALPLVPHPERTLLRILLWFLN